MISIHLYGKLRQYASDNSPSGESVLRLEAVKNETLALLLKRAGIDIEEIYTIFLNARLLTTHNSMARWLEYPQVCQDCHDWDLSIIIKDGDRIGLFGRDMAALVV
jgi:hypothetical protein